MNKLCVFFVMVVCVYMALGQGLRTGSHGDFLYPGPAQYPGRDQFHGQIIYPGQNTYPGQGQFPGQGSFPGQGRFSKHFPGKIYFPGQIQFPGQINFPGKIQFPGQRQLPEQGTGSSSVSTTQSPVVRDCIRNCPVTSEYNPICGTNNVTYNNPSRMYCAQFCGVSVSLLRRSQCPTPTQ